MSYQVTNIFFLNCHNCQAFQNSNIWPKCHFCSSTVAKVGKICGYWPYELPAFNIFKKFRPNCQTILDSNFWTKSPLCSSTVAKVSKICKNLHYELAANQNLKIFRPNVQALRNWLFLVKIQLCSTTAWKVSKLQNCGNQPHKLSANEIFKNSRPICLATPTMHAVTNNTHTAKIYI